MFLYNLIDSKTEEPDETNKKAKPLLNSSFISGFFFQYVENIFKLIADQHFGNLYKIHGKTFQTRIDFIRI